MFVPRVAKKLFQDGPYVDPGASSGAGAGPGAAAASTGRINNRTTHSYSKPKTTPTRSAPSSNALSNSNALSSSGHSNLTISNSNTPPVNGNTPTSSGNITPSNGASPSMGASSSGSPPSSGNSPHGGGGTASDYRRLEMDRLNHLEQVKQRTLEEAALRERERKSIIPHHTTYYVCSCC